MSTPSSPQPTGRRSSMGTIALGDNSGPALATMPENVQQARASKARQRAISNTSLDDRKAPAGSSSAVVDSEDKPLGPLAYVWTSYREYSYQNTWLNPLLTMLVVVGAYYAQGNQGPSNPLHKFIFPSYRLAPHTELNPTDDYMYGKGKWDFTFVGFYMIFFTFFREFVMQMILRPFASYCGVTKKGKINRFMEQTYSIIYYTMAGSLGLYIMYQTPIWFFNTTSFYENFPHKTHMALFKVYYLMQAAFWGQQSVILCLQLEKPRKDFKELVFHHIVTIALIWCSYRFHFTWMGLCVYVTMDVSDVFLAVSKTLNYVDHAITGPFFLLFMGVWVYTRHYLNLKILYSILTEFATVGPFELNWVTQQYKCTLSQRITFALLAALQLVNAYWCFLIFRIAYRFVFYDVQKDERSDDEDEEEEEEETKKDK
ncbi:Sphingosine N-acyltransferase LAC1 [Yarrowia sp. E02]|nr:Sphingosine N-acyltransferase LAC1 [Yarrowia sp. E02]